MFGAGPYGVESAREMFGAWEDFGIYMITRKWGDSEKILYIGLVYWRSFAERIAEHDRDLLWNVRGKINVRVGRIRLGGGSKHSYERMEDVENLLIYMYQPEFNYKGRGWYYGREIKIINLGRRGPLDKIVSSERL